MATSGMVSEWLGGDNPGIYRELANEVVENGVAVLNDWGPAFDPFAMAAYLDDKVAADGIDVLLHTRCVDVCKDGDQMTHVVLHNKSGFTAVEGRAFVDATGDADVAALSGCEIVKGREEDGLMTPLIGICFSPICGLARQFSILPTF